ncbi:uncharacterized protein [Chelonus insularis]|uniref:uncharacterized protein n=1 Tax=Chelonus insularis TaxID=460826 RepID=UPI001589F194|nr:uncharacterized protein LOC118068247 [Chelonus insularis]
MANDIMDYVVNILEKDTRGFEIITYGVTSIGLLTALYKIRPFAKFSNPQKVPSHFIKKLTKLTGTVARIEPGTPALLMVDHKPLIPIPRFGQEKHLPVKIVGVNVTGNGISWLSTIVQGNIIEFVPIQKTTKYLECSVIMPQKNKDPLKIGEELVKLGFGIVGEIPISDPNNKVITSYKKSLIDAQKWAKFKRNGHWHFEIPPSFWWRIKNTMSEKLTFNFQR